MPERFGLGVAEEGRCPMATTTGVPIEARSETTAGSWTRILATNACPRCGGLLVREPFADLWEDGARPDHAARRCVQCGEIIDPIILRNRSPRRSSTVEADWRALAVQGFAERS
jgi:hypothetical protein